MPILVDTGVMISIIKSGISKKKIRPSQITTKCVIVSELRVYGLQEVSVNIGNTRAYHDFVVADLHTTCNGLIWTDLMKQLGLNIDFSTCSMYIGDDRVGQRSNRNRLCGAGPAPLLCEWKLQSDTGRR